MFRSGGGDHPAALGALEPTDLEALASVDRREHPPVAGQLQPMIRRLGVMADVGGLVCGSLVQVLFEDFASCDI